MTVLVAGVIIYKSSGDAVKKNASIYAEEAAKQVNLELSKDASISDIKTTLLGLQGEVNGSLWVLDDQGELIVSLNPNYKSIEKFSSTNLTISAVVTDNKGMMDLDRKTMVSALQLKDIFNKGYYQGFGSYDPAGLGTKVVAFHLLPDKKWLIGVDVPISTAYSEVNNLKNNIVKLCVLIFIVTIISTMIAVKKIIKPFYNSQEKLRKNIENNNDKLMQLHELSSVMQQKLDSGDRYNLISKSILELLQIDRVNMFLLSNDMDYLVCETIKEDISSAKVTLKIPLTKEGGIISKVYKEKKIMIYDTLDEALPLEYMISEQLMQGTNLLAGAFVLLPLIVQNKCIGIAIADNHLSKKKITKETIEFLEIVMGQAVVAIENIELYQKLMKYTNQLETTDPLTQLYNFSYFKDMLEDSINFRVNKDIKFTLGIVYISNFSIYNEKNGHRSGDIALKKIASILEDSVINNCVVGRCYGAQFSIIFNGIDGNGAKTFLNKIKDSIEKTSFKGFESLDEKAFKVTVSSLEYLVDEKLSCDEFFKRVEDLF